MTTTRNAPALLTAAALLAATLACACGEEQPGPAEKPIVRPEPTPTPAPEPPPSRDALARRVQGFLDSWSQREAAFLDAYKADFEAALKKLRWFRKLSTAGYEARGFALLFSDGQDLRPAADLMIAALDDVEAHGLDAEPYQREVVRERLQASAAAKEAYLGTLVPSGSEQAASFWKLAEKLRATLAVSHRGVVSVLSEAGLDDGDLALVDAAEERLTRMFEAKERLNTALRDLDLALLQGLFRYAYDMRFARRVHPFDADESAAAGVERVADQLRELYDATDFGALDVALAELEPKIPEYRAMMKGLAFYRRLAAEHDHAELPKKARRLRRGSKGEVVVALQRRLVQEGYLEGEADGQYGETLEEAVRLYQEVHQLDQTGAMDKSTLSSLNKSYAERAQQIELGLQRHRESDLHQGEVRFSSADVLARVNIPAFQATFFRGGEPARRHRVVVGSNAVGTDEETGLRGHFNRTRLFSERMTTIVLNPTWRVPSRIKEQELDAKLLEEPDFYEKHNYELVIQDDGSEDAMQLPGPNNALGLVKFLFPNEYSIYMHDTPKKRLFGREIRAFSHGCMRTDGALELAKWVLTEVEEMTPERFDQILESRKTYGIALKTKIPITIDYNTVGVHESGRIMFYLDVYKFDRDLGAGKTPYPKGPPQLRFSQVVLLP